MPEHSRDVREVCVSTITVKATSTMTESQPRETGCMGSSGNCRSDHIAIGNARNSLGCAWRFLPRLVCEYGTMSKEQVWKLSHIFEGALGWVASIS